jgi:hypothetical protein
MSRTPLKICATSSAFQARGGDCQKAPRFASGEILFTHTAYFALHGYALRRAQALDQIRQGEQIRWAEQRSPG